MSNVLSLIAAAALNKDKLEEQGEGSCRRYCEKCRSRR